MTSKDIYDRLIRAVHHNTMSAQEAAATLTSVGVSASISTSNQIISGLPSYPSSPFDVPTQPSPDEIDRRKLDHDTKYQKDKKKLIGQHDEEWRLLRRQALDRIRLEDAFKGKGTAELVEKYKERLKNVDH